MAKAKGKAGNLPETRAKAADEKPPPAATRKTTGPAPKAPANGKGGK